jgi:F-type H+-transporting ATPase subunit b
MITPDYTVLVQIANFLLLLLLLNILFYRPIRKILGRRDDEVRSFQDMIKEFQDRFIQNEKALQENAVAARKQGLKEKEDLKTEGLDAEKDIVGEATSSAEERIGEAREMMLENLGNVRQSLRSEVESFSRDLVEKILARSI